MKGKLTVFERRIEMLFMLMQCRKSTIDELATTFSVCRNTAYNDIVFLSRYAPIYTKNGIHGGVYLLDGYRNELFLFLTRDEENLLKLLAEPLERNEKVIMHGILNRFSMPNPGT